MYVKAVCILLRRCMCGLGVLRHLLRNMYEHRKSEVSVFVSVGFGMYEGLGSTLGIYEGPSIGANTVLAFKCYF